MKKSILGLTVSALFMVGSAQATTNPNDVSANLMITGTVVQDIADSCSVTLDKTSLHLSDTDVNALITQGEDATTPVQVKLNIAGGDDCTNKVAEGTMAFKFTGLSDNADGTVISNNDNSNTGAKGVGIGVFDTQNKMVRLNSEDNIVASTTDTNIGLQMVKLNGQTPTAGAVSATLTVEIQRL
ncbi:fimbrial protein [Cronobacter turicensis]|nr:fimbrial protein [Cronobacter turicensis]ELQ6076021.1 fimbrial protein [Cronobacter turicensis]ELQ6181864.1 fimbrial protein [Cronobacter turicensis]ELQ6233984.1 fimbrial protein [Cronobacter turicensis]ELQ6237709.1 fimbrial protein [Cronobacter turicensis]